MRHFSRATLPFAVAVGLLYASGATAATWTMAGPSDTNPMLITVKDGNGGGHGGGNGGGNGGSNGGGNSGGGNAGGKSDAGDTRGKSADRGSVDRASGAPADSSLDDDTDVAVSRPGRARQLDDGTFRNHGARVSTSVALSKELGYGARVGAMQGNFGTPQETGIRALEEHIAALEADPTTDPRVIDALEAELAERTAAVKPGTGPSGGWESTNLDVDGDGVVDEHDLSLARQGFRPFD
ncbi:hypothetical protein AB4Z01_31860 [Inquilinus sp. YAF38]|uniref:hypothetical protein n=1 Tax=Inquilinus sp. YAF38 TaxID=3233084 RepID=UPI003F913DE9